MQNSTGIGKAVDFTLNVVQKYNQDIDKTMKFIDRISGKTFKAGIDITGNASQTMKDIEGKILNFTNKKFNTAIDLSYKVDKATEKVKKIEQNTHNMINKPFNAVLNVTDNVSTNLKKLHDNTLNFTNTSFNAAINLTGNINEKLKEIRGQSTGLAGKVIDIGIELSGNANEKLTEMYGKALEMHQKVFKPAIEFVGNASETIKNVQEQLNFFHGQVFKPVIELGGDAVQKVKDFKENTTGITKKVFKPGMDAAGKMQSGLKAGKEMVPGLLGKTAGLKIPTESITKAGEQVKSLSNTGAKAFTGIKNSAASFGAGLKLMRAQTIMATISQWGFNAALFANPVTWIVIGIVALIAAIVLLVKNWDKVKAAAIACWETIKGWIAGAPDWLLGIISPILLIIKHWDDVKAAVVSIWDAIVSTFSNVGAWFYQNVISPILNIMPDWLKKFFGVGSDVTVNASVKENEQFKGGDYPQHSTGLSYVPYDGYVAGLHKGERVMTASENRAYSNPKREYKGNSANGGGNTFNITINGVNKSTSEIINDLVTKISEAVNIMGEVAY